MGKALPALRGGLVEQAVRPVLALRADAAINHMVNEFFWALRLDRTPFLLFSQKGGFQNGRLPDNSRIS